MWKLIRTKSRRSRPTSGPRRIEERMRAAERSLCHGRLEAAIRQCLAIAGEARENLSHLNLAGDLLVRAEQVERAVPLFLKVGEAYADQGFWSKAIAIYHKILRCDPGREDVVVRLAWLYQQSGQPTGST